VYSTFLNRAWDQVVYDVALHQAPVVFALDRAGVTGPDGASHHGMYDLALLTKVPGMRVLAPSSAQELQQMLHDAIALADDGPVTVRYARGAAPNVTEAEVGVGLHARRISAPDGAEVCILAVGRLVTAATKAAEQLAAEGTPVTVWDVRSCAPLDPDMLADAARHARVVTVEDGVRAGGVGMAIADRLCTLDPGVRVDVLGLPTEFIQQAKPERILARFGLDAAGIADTIRRATA
jgi:1-deoxy-D-xylulose-5-phosphate synthase